MSNALEERPATLVNEFSNWVTLDEAWEPDDAAVFAGIKAMRAMPLALSGAAAAAFEAAKRVRSPQVAQPLPVIDF